MADDDQTFDVVVIQFGVMFFPDKAKALSETRRVLRPGGALIFNVWDALPHNKLADAVQAGLANFFPDDRPSFWSVRRMGISARVRWMRRSRPT